MRHANLEWHPKVNLQFQLPFVPFPLEYELFVGVAAVGELLAIIAIVVIVASAFVASHIVASCIVATSVGVVDQPQQDVGGGRALNIVAGVDHLAVAVAVAVEAFVALVVAALVVAALVSALVVPSLVVAASKIVETPHQIKRWLGRWLVAWLGR